MINNVFIAIWFKCKKTCAKNSIGYNAFQLQIETCCNLKQRLIYLLSKFPFWLLTFFITPGRSLFSVIQLLIS